MLHFKMPLKGKRECNVCKKVVSGSNFSRHSKLHSYCDLCGIWTWKNRHFHDSIAPPVFQQGQNLVQIWVPHVVPYHSIQNYLSNVPVSVVEPPKPPPDDDLEKFLSEFLDPNVSIVEKIISEVGGRALVPFEDPLHLISRYNDILKENPQFTDCETLRKEVFDGIDRPDVLDNDFFLPCHRKE